MFRHTHIGVIAFPGSFAFSRRSSTASRQRLGTALGTSCAKAFASLVSCEKEILTVKKVGRHSRNLPPSLSLSLSPLHPEKYLCSLTHNHTTHYIHYMTSHSIPLQACTRTHTPYEFVYIYIYDTHTYIYIYIYKTVVSSN